MLAKLNQTKNAGKGSWLNCKKRYLLWRMVQESYELARALFSLYFAERKFMKNPSTGNRDMRNLARHNVADEAADVANFAMMLADKVGGLER
jgi:NTP pyrophosphatase (non-canonical NTP hydrolase)